MEKSTIFLMLFVVSLLTSCLPKQYIANDLYIPLNKEKHELNVTLGGTPVLLRFNAQVGYTITNHIGIFGAALFRFDQTQMDFTSDETRETDMSVGKYGIKEINAGFNYFTSINKHNFELVCGGGYGKTNYEFDYYYKPDLRYFYKMDANKLSCYIQPDYSYTLGKHLEIGLFSRFLYSRYYDVSSSLEYNNTPIKPEEKYYLNRKTANLYFIEPGFLFRITKKAIKFQLSYSRSQNVNDELISYSKDRIKITVIFDVKKLFKTKE